MPLIIPHLGNDSVTLYAQRSLKQFGDRLVHTLRDSIDDRGERDSVRRAIPGCYAAVGTQKALNTLLAILQDHQADYGSEIVEALGELHARYPEHEVDANLVEAALMAEADAAKAGNPEGDGHLRKLMSLLALIYPADDVLRAYAGMTSGQKDVASNAVELLDNLLQADHKRSLLPLIESYVA